MSNSSRKFDHGTPVAFTYLSEGVGRVVHDNSGTLLASPVSDEVAPEIWPAWDWLRQFDGNEEWKELGIIIIPQPPTRMRRSGSIVELCDVLRSEEREWVRAHGAWFRYDENNTDVSVVLLVDATGTVISRAENAWTFDQELYDAQNRARKPFAPRTSADAYQGVTSVRAEETVLEALSPVTAAGETFSVPSRLHDPQAWSDGWTADREEFTA